MKNQLRKLLNVALLLSLIILSSCEKNLYDEAIVQEKKGISTKRVSLKELDSKTNAELFKAASRVKNKVEKLEGRMVYDSIYDFYFDDEKGIYLNINGKESYTFPIYRKNSDDKIENIIFTENDNGTYDILLSKYDFDREELATMTVEELNNSLIEYTALFDANRSLAPQLVCIETQSFQLVSDNAGGIPTQQPLMHYEWVTTGSYCFWTGGPGGGGGGGFEPSNTNNGGTTGNQNNSSTGGTGGIGVNTALNSGYTLAQYNFVNSLNTSSNISVEDNFVTIDNGAQNIILNYIEANKTNTSLINTVQYFIRNTDLVWLGLQPASVQTSIMNYVVQNNFSTVSRNFMNELINVVKDDSVTDENAFLFVLKAKEQNMIENDLDDTFLLSVDHLIDLDVANYNSMNPNDPLMMHFSIQCAVLRANHSDWSDTKIYWEASKDIVHIVLDVLGLVPVVGEVADLTNGVLYTIEGDGVNATLSVASAVPIAGWAAVSTKYAVKIIDASHTATSIATKVKLTWKVVGNTIEFGNRGHLRKVLGITASNIQAHHLIPWSSQTKMAVQKAAKYGSAFHMNEALNGIAVAAWRNQPNHNAYNSLIDSKLDTFRDLYPNASPQECYNFLTDLINDIRTWVINNPNSHLNDLVLP